MGVKGTSIYSVSKMSQLNKKNNNIISKQNTIYIFISIHLGFITTKLPALANKTYIP
jgi:hypothetical protein